MNLKSLFLSRGVLPSLVWGTFLLTSISSTAGETQECYRQVVRSSIALIIAQDKTYTDADAKRYNKLYANSDYLITRFFGRSPAPVLVPRNLTWMLISNEFNPKGVSIHRSAVYSLSKRAFNEQGICRNFL